MTDLDFEIAYRHIVMPLVEQGLPRDMPPFIALLRVVGGAVVDCHTYALPHGALTQMEKLQETITGMLDDLVPNPFVNEACIVFGGQAIGVTCRSADAPDTPQELLNHPDAQRALVLMLHGASAERPTRVAMLPVDPVTRAVTYVSLTATQGPMREMTPPVHH